MKQPWKIVLVLVGIFLAGGVTGAFVMLRVGRQLIAHRPGPEQWAPNHLKRLMDRLDLQPEQVEQIRPIVRRHMEKLNRLRAETVAETRSEFGLMEREISEKLTPEQRAKFEQMNREMRERAKRFMPDRKNRPGPPGSPPPAEPAKPGTEPPPPGS